MVACPQGRLVLVLAGLESRRFVVPADLVAVVTGMVMPDAPPRML